MIELHRNESATKKRISVDEAAINSVSEGFDGTTVILNSKQVTVAEDYDEVMAKIADTKGIVTLNTREICCLLMLMNRLCEQHGEDDGGVMLKHGAFLRSGEDDPNHLTLWKKLRRT